MKNKWSKKKKAWIIALGGLVGVVLLISALSGGGDQLPMVTTASVVQKDLEETVNLKAPLEGSEAAEVVSNLHYEVTALHVKEGDMVKRGQLLAVLDNTALAEAVDQAADALSLAERQLAERLKQDQLAYDQALRDQQWAQQQWERSHSLYEAGALSLTELEEEEKALKQAQDALSIFTVQQDQVVAGSVDQKTIEMAGKTLEQRRQDFESGEITSPIDGTVTRVNIRLGRFADETDGDRPMFVIENLDQLQMKVAVSEYDIAKISVGQPVSVGADILDGARVSGEVTRISPTGELKEGSNAERVIPTVISIEERNDKLIAGINANAKIQIDRAENALVIPIEAVLETPDGPVVYKVDEKGIVAIIPISTGVSSDLEVAIQGENLADGDRVILMPPADLPDGAQVMARN